MGSFSTSFTEAGASGAFTLKPGQSLTYSVSNTYTGFVDVYRSRTCGQTWDLLKAGAEDAAYSGSAKNETHSDEWFRFVARDTDSETPMTGTADTVFADAVDMLHEWKAPDGTVVLRITDEGIETPKVTPQSVARTSQKIIIPAALGKAGATAGWVTEGTTNVSLATCPASQTASTLVVPLPRLKVGDTITGFHLIGQIESGGNAVTVDADLRKMTAAAADVADASVGAITQLSVIADTIMSASNTSKAVSEVVGADETFYLLITATTLGSTDIALQGVAVTITEA